MQATPKISDRKKVSALIAGLILPGMGQMYNGELAKGLCFFAIFLMAVIAGARTVMFAPNGLLSAGFVVVFAFAIVLYGVFGIEAWRAASRKGAGYMCKWYNTWYAYVAAWMLLSVFVTGSAFSFVSDNIVQFCRVATASMKPVVFPGDFVIVDKTYYKHNPPARGDIILFRFPDDRSKLYIKRIEGLPGDTIKLEPGNTVVPHRAVFVLGDNREHSDDSRHYGPILLTDVLGKVRQVYFSFDINKGEIRWERMSIPLQ
jgi:signal peptidase I